MMKERADVCSVFNNDIKRVHLSLPPFPSSQVEETKGNIILYLFQQKQPLTRH